MSTQSRPARAFGWLVALTVSALVVIVLLLLIALAVRALLDVLS